MESSKTAKALAIASDRYNVFYSDTGLHEVNVPRSYLERLAKGGYVIQGSEIDGTPFTIEPGATEGG